MIVKLSRNQNLQKSIITALKTQYPKSNRPISPLARSDVAQNNREASPGPNE